MPFGMAGLDFCVWNPYRNREKTFLQKELTGKKFMHPEACCTDPDIKHEPSVWGGSCLCMKKLVQSAHKRNLTAVSMWPG